jgi:hypothetical protein
MSWERSSAITGKGRYFCGYCDGILTSSTEMGTLPCLFPLYPFFMLSFHFTGINTGACRTAGGGRSFTEIYGIQMLVEGLGIKGSVVLNIPSLKGKLIIPLLHLALQ